jgi:hypothetical protein
MADAFLNSYEGQSTEELLALESQYRIDSLVLAFEQAIQAKAPESLSVEETYVLAVEALEREVNNGGYQQFFTNNLFEFVPAVIEQALRAIDAIAALAIDSLTAGKAAAAASNASDAIRDALGACDDRYFVNDEAIADRLFRWIAANPQKIRVGGV